MNTDEHGFRMGRRHEFARISRIELMPGFCIRVIRVIRGQQMWLRWMPGFWICGLLRSGSVVQVVDPLPGSVGLRILPSTGSLRSPVATLVRPCGAA